MKSNSAAFCLTVVLGLGVAFSVRAKDLNGQDTTLSGKAIAVTTDYTNSSDKLCVLTFEPDETSRHYQGKISGHIKLVVANANQSGVVVVQNAASHSHDGGTVVSNYVQLTQANVEYSFGSQPIVVAVNSTNARNGGVGFKESGQKLLSPIVLRGTGSENTGYLTTYANIFVRNGYGNDTVGGDVTVQDCAGVALHHGGQCTYAAGKKMDFEGVIQAAGADVYLTVVSNTVSNFKNDFTAKRLLCAYYTAASRLGRINLSAGKNFTFDAIELAGHFINVNGTLNDGCVLAFTPTTDGSVDNAVNKAKYGNTGTKDFPDPEISKFTFGADQTINCVTGVALTATQAAQPGMVLKGSGKTLTLKCALASAECSARVSDSLGLTLNATNKDNVQAFLSRTNDTTGALNVQKGVFKIGAGASFPNVSSVTVGADGTLAIDTAVENPIPVSTVLALTTGAKVDVAAGASVTVDSVTMDGVQVRKDDLVAAGVLTGAGTFEVTNEPPPFTDGVWTAETSGDWSVTANWENGKVASGAEATATFRTAGTMDEPVVVTVDSERAVGVVEVEAGHVRLVGTQMLDLGGDDLDGALSAVSADASLEVAGAVKAMTEPLTLNPVAADDAASAGRILWNATSFTGGSGVTPRLRTGFGTVAFKSFDFLSGSAGLLLGGGTVAYTGAADATIPGFTIYDTGAGAGVIDVTNANVTLTVSGAVATGDASAINALAKYGPGRLTLLGDAAIGGTTGQVGAELTLANGSTVPNGFGAAANGTGPTNGVASLNVIGGTLQVGDADHAPTVETSYGLIIGGRAFRADAGLPGQAGHFVLSNGTVTVTRGKAMLGYYGPQANANGTFPTVSYTQFGGTFAVGDLFRVGYAYNTSGLQKSNQKFTLNGGTFACKGFEVGYSQGPRSDGLKANIVVNGGLLSVDGDFSSQRRNNGTRAVFVGNGGRMEVSGSVRGYRGAAFNSSAYPTSFTFNDGFTLKTAKFVGRENKEYPNRTYCNVSFNGGVWEQPLADATFSDFCAADTVEAKDGGFNVCLTNDAAKSYSLAIIAAIEGNGGLTFFGPGFAKFGADFANSTFKGALVMKDGAVVRAQDDTFQNLSVTVAPNGALRVAKDARASIKNLTLGAVGATAPACIQMATNSAIKVTGDLKVLSPVVFKYASSDLPNATLSGTTDFDGFTIDAKTISSYDRELFQLDPSDREAGYGLRVQRVSTADGSRLSVKIAKRSCLIGVIR